MVKGEKEMSNSKGQVWGYTLMLGLTIIILGLALSSAGQEFVNNTMNATVGDTLGLDCDNSSISNFDKGTCVITDFSTAYFFGGLIFIGGAVIVVRLKFGGEQ